MSQSCENMKKISSSLDSLCRDIEKNNIQDSTKNNLRSLVSEFDQLNKMVQGKSTSELQACMKEHEQKAGEKEQFQQHLHQIRSQMQKIEQKMQSNPDLKKKLQEKMPQDKKNEDFNKMLMQCKSTIETLENLQMDQPAKMR